MSSDTTSSDNDIPIFDKFGNDIPIPPFKKETTDTDLYFGLIANPSKSKIDTEKSTSSLHFDNEKKDSNTSSVRQSYKPSNERKESIKNKHQSTRESDRDSYRSRASRHSTESSKARYEDVRLSDKSAEQGIFN